jgi:hypothetical protein
VHPHYHFPSVLSLFQLQISITLCLGVFVASKAFYNYMYCALLFYFDETIVKKFSLTCGLVRHGIASNPFHTILAFLCRFFQYGVIISWYLLALTCACYHHYILQKGWKHNIGIDTDNISTYNIIDHQRL